MHSDPSFASCHRCTANGGGRRFALANDQCSTNVAEATANVNGHVVLLGELDRSIVHHTSAKTSQFQHLVIADLAHVPGFGQLPWIGRVHTIDIGMNFASISTQCCSQCDSRGVTTTATQRRNVAFVVDALESSRNHNVACIQ